MPSLSEAQFLLTECVMTIASLNCINGLVGIYSFYLNKIPYTTQRADNGETDAVTLFK